MIRLFIAAFVCFWSHHADTNQVTKSSLTKKFQQITLILWNFFTHFIGLFKLTSNCGS